MKASRLVSNHAVVSEPRGLGIEALAIASLLR